MTTQELHNIHEHTFHNRQEISRSKICGCIACCAIFSAIEVDEYIDDNQTVLCPRCMVDAVIGDAAGYKLSKNFLTELNQTFF